MQKCGLPGPTTSYDRDNLPQLDPKIYPCQYLEFTAVSAYKHLTQSPGFNGGGSQTAGHHVRLIHAESHGPAEAEKLAGRDRWWPARRSES